MKKAAGIAAYWQAAASSKGPNPAQCRCKSPAAGRRLKTSFTICRWRRYDAGMLFLAASALAATLSQPPQAAPDRQARATVRIVSGEKLRFSEMDKRDPSQFRETVLQSTNGSRQTVKLIEFQ